MKLQCAVSLNSIFYLLWNLKIIGFLRDNNGYLMLSSSDKTLKGTVVNWTWRVTWKFFYCPFKNEPKNDAGLKFLFTSQCASRKTRTAPWASSAPRVRDLINPARSSFRINLEFLKFYFRLFISLPLMFPTLTMTISEKNWLVTERSWTTNEWVEPLLLYLTVYKRNDLTYKVIQIGFNVQGYPNRI